MSEYVPALRGLAGKKSYEPDPKPIKATKKGAKKK